jgi:hypothetical protein
MMRAFAPLGLFSTNEIVLLKYNHDACLSCHKLSYQIETSAYTGKAPLLYFFGTEDGEMYKWEKLQLNLYNFRQTISLSKMLHHFCYFQ